MKFRCEDRFESFGKIPSGLPPSHRNFMTLLCNLWFPKFSPASVLEFEYPTICKLRLSGQRSDRRAEAMGSCIFYKVIMPLFGKYIIWVNVNILGIKIRTEIVSRLACWREYGKIHC